MSYIISVPRIIAWVKRQPKEKIVGITGSNCKCVVAEFCKDTFKTSVIIQPYASQKDDGKGYIELYRGVYIENRAISKAVCDLAVWFDHIHGGSTGSPITASEFLAKWEARVA